MFIPLNLELSSLSARLEYRLQAALSFFDMDCGGNHRNPKGRMPDRIMFNNFSSRTAYTMPNEIGNPQ
jgi:hypothetical protein